MGFVVNRSGLGFPPAGYSAGDPSTGGSGGSAPASSGGGYDWTGGGNVMDIVQAGSTAFEKLTAAKLAAAGQANLARLQAAERRRAMTLAQGSVADQERTKRYLMIGGIALAAVVAVGIFAASRRSSKS